MKKITLLLLLITTISCKQKKYPYDMYGILTLEFTRSTEYLETQIAKNLKNEKLIIDQAAQSYDSLTTEYLKYLDKTYSELIAKIEYPFNYGDEIFKEHINEFFFDEDKYNPKGTEFISKLENYRTEILELITEENLANQVRIELNTDYVMNHKGKKFNYLHSKYQDLPLISVLAHMKNREKSILEFENDFLKNRMLYK